MKGMTPLQLRDYILEHLTAEEALLILLEGPLHQYEKLRFDKGGEVHPLIIIANAAMELGWDFVIEKEGAGGDDQVHGVTVGDKGYMERLEKDFK